MFLESPVMFPKNKTGLLYIVRAERIVPLKNLPPINKNVTSIIRQDNLFGFGM